MNYAHSKLPVSHNYMMTSPFDILPDEQIIVIALNSSLTEIVLFCQANLRMNNLLCNNNYFWQQKFIQDYGQPVERIVDWREAYQNYGKVMTMGYNKEGQLGLGNRSFEVNIPTLISNIRVKKVIGGAYHTFFIDLQDNVFTSGSNQYGQLGQPFAGNFVSPIPLNFKAKDGDCGDFFSMLIDLDNNLFGCGDNIHGQLGLGIDVNKIGNLTRVPDPRSRTLQPMKVKQVACGDEHTIVIDMNNNVWSCGINANGQLGLGDTQSRNILTQIGSLTAKYIACGEGHTVLIDLDDNVWVFGDNESGQLGIDGTHLTPTQLGMKAKQVACGSIFTVLIDMNNDVWVFGDNSVGELGIPAQDEPIRTPVMLNFKAKDVSCGGLSIYLLDFDNNVWTTDETAYSVPVENGPIPFKIPNLLVQSIYTGLSSIFFVLKPNPNIPNNASLITFNQAAAMLSNGEFMRFVFKEEFQSIPHRSGNRIASFYGINGKIYLVELQYDWNTHQIYPPI